ncbi:hypothetical protein PPERSA_02682 [Pseudocohnilembus persalinus]|uniref:Transmembrane protein n=1 Tax=Pseudocohnilembus persalinus TaxID=266149 RepID=A0A0V0R5N2_PSEPJ|nr:hypothetical protein PPERSA_02682 [Pseudocohnilembus persalinus]|eukprot:KRX09810.1 hypothetical protein PPERSA_02682 [Pseudocohnilembus persalinus]
MQSIEPRYIEIQNIKIPKEHSVSQIIVLPDMNGMGFRYDTYSPKLIGLVSEEQFKETVRNATFLCQKMYTNDQKKQAQDPFALQKKILIFLIPFTLISMILYILRIYIDELKNNNGLIYSATILQAIVILGVFYAFITSMTSKFEPINIEQKIQNELMSFFIEENKKPVYKQNCVRWEVPPRFLWLEITIDFERNGKKPYIPLINIIDQNNNKIDSE